MRRDFIDVNLFVKNVNKSLFISGGNLMGLLQPRLPLRKNIRHGPYDSFEEENIAQSLHQDLLILLKTIPGEWPMRPDLGVGLAKYLFESSKDFDFLKVKNKIKTQVKKYLPVIEVTNVKINTDPDLVDLNQASINIEYYIKPLGLVGSMNIFADGWTQADEIEQVILRNRKEKSVIKRNF